jgi:arylsulfatase
VKTKGYCTNLFFEQAMKWIKEQNQAGKKFFAYIPTNVMHGPQQPPTPENVLNDPSETGGKTGILKNFDSNVGRIMKFQKTNDMLKDTLVIFVTDNGSNSGRKQLKGGKGSAYEGGIRVPCFFYWKGRIEGGVESDRLTGIIDFWATLAELAGSKAKAPGAHVWDGRSIVPLLENPDADWSKRYIVGHRTRWKGGGSEQAKYSMSSIQDETFKLVNNKELYDLTRDLSEKRNIAEQHPDVVKELQEVYERFWQDVQPYMVNETAAAENPVVKPYHELYRKQFGEEAMNEAMKNTRQRKGKKRKGKDRK